MKVSIPIQYSRDFTDRFGYPDVYEFEYNNVIATLLRDCNRMHVNAELPLWAARDVPLQETRWGTDLYGRWLWDQDEKLAPFDNLTDKNDAVNIHETFVIFKQPGIFVIACCDRERTPGFVLETYDISLDDLVSRYAAESAQQDTTKEVLCKC